MAHRKCVYVIAAGFSAGLEAIPEDQIVLIGCAAGFQDERLREMVGQILSEKQRQPN